MKIKSFVFGPFATNCYVWHDQENAWIIDPACSSLSERQLLAEYIASTHLTVRGILATHGHLDHLWGAAWACRQWNLPVLIHPNDIPMAQTMQEQYNLFGISQKAVPFETVSLIDHFFAAKGHDYFVDRPASPDRIQTELQIIHTPGHTPGSVCLYDAQEGVLFSGDTLFRMGYGRTDLPGGNTSQLIQSLGLLFDLPDEVRVFPGHGESTTIGTEKRI